jgi:hypothetical protein
MGRENPANPTILYILMQTKKGRPEAFGPPFSVDVGLPCLEPDRCRWMQMGTRRSPQYSNTVFTFENSFSP